MLNHVAYISVSDALDEFLRAQTKKLGQSKMAELIGTKRQGVNAIMNRKTGRRFTFEHLERFAEKSGIMTSTLLAELANLTWNKEKELKGANGPFSMPATPATGEPVSDVLDLLREILEERRKRR